MLQFPSPCQSAEAWVLEAQGGLLEMLSEELPLMSPLVQQASNQGSLMPGGHPKTLPTYALGVPKGDWGTNSFIFILFF